MPDTLTIDFIVSLSAVELINKQPYLQRVQFTESVDRESDNESLTTSPAGVSAVSQRRSQLGEHFL